jgi:integral membrane protein
VKSVFGAYRVLATIVGIFLIPLFLGWGFELFASGDLHELAENVTNVLGPLHGLLYMLFFVSAVLLSRQEGWELPFTIVTVVCGTIPVASFWAEHRASVRVRHAVSR